MQNINCRSKKRRIFSSCQKLLFLHWLLFSHYICFSCSSRGATSISLRTFMYFSQDFREFFRWSSHQLSVFLTVENSPSNWGIGSCFLLLLICNPLTETPLNPQRSKLSASLSAYIDEVESTGAVLEDETETVGTKEAGEEEEVTGGVAWRQEEAVYAGETAISWHPGDGQLTDCFFSFLMVHGVMFVEKDKLEGKREQMYLRKKRRHLDFQGYSWD